MPVGTARVGVIGTTVGLGASGGGVDIAVGVGRVEVGLGDGAVRVLGGIAGAVGGEPLVGGDDGVGVGVGGVAFGEHGLGAFGLDPGHGGVGEPLGAGVVELLQGGGLLVEGGGERGGVGGLPGEPGVPGGVASGCGGVGLRCAERGGLVLVGGGLAGAGEFVADVAGRPWLLPLPRADPHPQLPVGQLASPPGRPPGGPRPATPPVGGVGLDLPGLAAPARGRRPSSSCPDSSR